MRSADGGLITIVAAVAMGRSAGILYQWRSINTPWLRQVPWECSMGTTRSPGTRGGGETLSYNAACPWGGRRAAFWCRLQRKGHSRMPLSPILINRLINLNIFRGVIMQLGVLCELRGSPARMRVTLAPTAATTPTPSWPGVPGRSGLRGYLPSIVFMSDGLMGACTGARGVSYCKPMDGAALYEKVGQTSSRSLDAVPRGC